MKKVLKLIIITAICVTLIGVMSGCFGKNTQDSANNPPAVSEPDNSGTPDGKGGDTDSGQDTGNNIGLNEFKQWDGVKGKILTDNYPEEITQYLKDKQDKESQQVYNINNKTYIVMTMGSQSTAGYQIELSDLILKDGILKVVAVYEKPGKDDNVAQVISYPVLVIETDDIYEGHYEITFDIEK